MADPRAFNKHQKFALFVAEGGVCAECGTPLTAGWHADHVRPWSLGGPTDVVNGRATCPKCNTSKGNNVAPKPQTQFTWQTRALDKYIAHDRDDFLLEGTPGCGKTRFAAEAANRKKQAGIIERIVVVVPTSHLRKQTAVAFKKWTGLDLDYKWESGSIFPGAPFAGVVVTYSAVGKGPAIFRVAASRLSTMVILDEIHHANAEANWGTGLTHAFDIATCRLLLSGTPFRSDNGAIPFVRYVDGVGVPDESIGYGEALAAGVVRYVYFPRCGGSMEWAVDWARYTATFEDDLDAIGQSRRLRTALQADGGHLSGMLQDAHADLMQKRQDDPDAGGLVVTMDQTHAQSVARQLAKLTGTAPVVVISDDPDSSGKLDAFAKSGAPWLVAVRMVSEGVDIPRLRVGVYATNIVTAMYFRQFVGRVVRREADHDDHSAAVFIPDDPRLRAHALQIREQIEAELAAEKDEPDDKVVKRKDPPMFVPLSSTMSIEGMIIAGEHQLTPIEIAAAEKTKMFFPETASLPTWQVALLLRAGAAGGWQAANRGGGGGSTAPHPDEMLVVVLKRLREKNNKVTSNIHYTHGYEFGKIHSVLNDRVGHHGKLKECSDKEKLERRLELALEWLALGDAWVTADAT